ncbi:hypothetical protein IGI04_039717, partial [Brassica rapa subsp. trilocularis]
IDDMARSRKRIRNMVAGPYNAATLFSRPDPSAYSSGTASTQEHVPESQSQGRSLQATLAPYVPPAPYEPAPYYPQFLMDNCLGQTVSDIIKANFWHTHPNLSLTLYHVWRTCFNKNKLVYCCHRKGEGSVKGMSRLKNNVGDWKDGANPIYVINDVWKGLKAYWNLPKSVRRFLKCSAARLTSDAEDNLPIPIHLDSPHTLGGGTYKLRTTMPTGTTLGPWWGCSMLLQRQTRPLHRCGRLYVRTLTPNPLWKNREI